MLSVNRTLSWEKKIVGLTTACAHLKGLSEMFCEDKIYVHTQCSSLYVNISCERTNAHSRHIVLFVAITLKKNIYALFFKKLFKI